MVHEGCDGVPRRVRVAVVTVSRVGPGAGASSLLVRSASLGAVLGPASFVAAWVAAGGVTERPHSPVDDAISRLAAVGSDVRPLMTAGLVGFGALVPVGAWAMRRSVSTASAVAASCAGLMTLAVAATPLDRSAATDRWHALAAGAGYAALAAAPLLGAAPLLRHGHSLLGALGAVSGSVAAASLALSAGTLPTGLFQRIGLTAVDAWLVAVGGAIAAGRLAGPRGRDRPGRRRPAGASGARPPASLRS